MSSTTEPVKFAGILSGVLSALATVAVALGWISQADVDALSGAVLGVVSAVAVLVSASAPILAALRARRKVTPTADPRNDAGVPLVPAVPAA